MVAVNTLQKAAREHTLSVASAETGPSGGQSHDCLSSAWIWAG
jgi:hypothetical protein